MMMISLMFFGLFQNQRNEKKKNFSLETTEGTMSTLDPLKATQSSIRKKNKKYPMINWKDEGDLEWKKK